MTDGVGTTRPVIVTKVVLGEFSPPEKLGYTWSVTKMTKRSLKLQINFENPIYVSTEEEPEQLEITFNGGQVFASEEGLLLEMPLFRETMFRAL